MYIKCNSDFDESAVFSSSVGARQRFAQNTDNAEALEILSYDPASSVRYAVALNTNTPSDTLERLLSDVPSVAHIALCNSNLSKDVLSDYINNADILDAAVAAYNKNLSPELISTLYNRVYDTLTGPGYVDAWERGDYDDEWIEFTHDLSDNPNTPVDIIFELSSVYDEYVYSSLACNPQTPARSLYSIASDCEETSTLSDVAAHPNATEEVLLRLMDSNYNAPDVCYTILERPHLSADFLAAMYNKCPYQWTDVRNAIKEQPNCPVLDEDKEEE